MANSETATTTIAVTRTLIAYCSTACSFGSTQAEVRQPSQNCADLARFHERAYRPPCNLASNSINCLRSSFVNAAVNSSSCRSISVFILRSADAPALVSRML